MYLIIVVSIFYWSCLSHRLPIAVTYHTSNCDRVTCKWHIHKCMYVCYATTYFKQELGQMKRSTLFQEQYVADIST